MDHIAGLGTAAGARVHPEILPQDVDYPAVAVTKVSEFRENELDGPSAIVEARYQVDTWSTSKDDVVAVSAAISASLDGFFGVMGAVTVLGVERENESSLPEKDGDQLLRRISQDYFIRYRA